MPDEKNEGKIRLVQTATSRLQWVRGLSMNDANIQTESMSDPPPHAGRRMDCSEVYGTHPLPPLLRISQYLSRGQHVWHEGIYLEQMSLTSSKNLKIKCTISIIQVLNNIRKE